MVGAVVTGVVRTALVTAVVTAVGRTALVAAVVTSAGQHSPTAVHGRVTFSG